MIPSLGGYLSLIDSDEDKKKFEFIYDNYKYRMYYICRDILQDYHLAEDALQEAFISIIKRLDKIEDVTTKQAACYVYLIAKSRAIDMYRKLSKDYEKTFPVECYGLLSYGEEQNFSEMEEQKDVMQAILSLKPLSRQILELYLEKQMTRGEIATLLNLKYDTVRKRIKTALLELRVELNKRGIYE